MDDISAWSGKTILQQINYNSNCQANWVHVKLSLTVNRLVFPFGSGYTENSWWDKNSGWPEWVAECGGKKALPENQLSIRLHENNHFSCNILLHPHNWFSFPPICACMEPVIIFLARYGCISLQSWVNNACLCKPKLGTWFWKWFYYFNFQFYTLKIYCNKFKAMIL